MGANGAGKSSLLKAIAGILRPTSGEIWLENCKLHALSAVERSRQFAYLAQQLNVAWQLSVYDVIALGLPAPLPPEQERQRCVRLPNNWRFLTCWTTLTNSSGGEQTRVQLARCLMKQAPILLADEPIAALDPYYQIDIMQQLKALTPTQTCVVVIHHCPLPTVFVMKSFCLKTAIYSSAATHKRS